MCGFFYDHQRRFAAMAKTNATQSGAENEASQPESEMKETPELNPRNAYLEQLAQAESQRQLEELGITETDAQIETQATDEKGAEPEPNEQPTPEPEANGKRMVKVKVDGEEIDVPEDEVIRSYQKDSAASKRLEAAAAKMREVEERERALNEREAQLSRQTQAQPDSTEPPPSTDDAAQQFLDAMYEGEGDKAKEALKKLLPQGRQETTQQVDVNAIVPTVAQQVRAQIERDNALEKFSKDYEDIVSDPYLASVADNFLKAELDANKDKTYGEALEEAGKQTRDWLKKLTPTPSTTRSEILAKKEQIDTVPTTNATSGGIGEQKEESASETITAMRKARGLPV
jgi:hypothetical protein